MDIEYFSETSVLLIYGHEPKIVSGFREQGVALADERILSFAVHELPGFRSIGSCQLFATRFDTDEGITLLQEPKTFECRLRPVTWNNISGLLEPFTDGSYFAATHQYLDHSGKIQLIISGGRGW